MSGMHTGVILMMRTAGKLAILLLALAGSVSARADIDPVYTGFFSNEAIRGYDAVAYFTEGKPVKGLDEFSVDYLGAEWKFASQEHLEMFRADPEAYAPQYGGYCAYAVANGETASAEPELWTIHEGKLYLNYNRRINAQFQQDIDSYIQQADQNWPRMEKR
jgi:YHS domain-containing protein